MIRTRRCACLVVLASAGLLAAAPPPAGAQATEAPARLRRALDGLADSARIRLMAPGVVVEDGVFLGVGSDSLLVADADARFRVGLDEVEALSLRGSRWRGMGAQVGAVGLVVGAAAGYFLAYFSCGHEVQDCGTHPRTVGLRFGLVFGTAGAIAGGILGSRMGVWREVFP